MAVKAAHKVTLVRVNDGAKGDQGDKGDTGIGVSAIVEQYYLSTSSTSQSGGSWSKTSPSWSSGHYIWTRSKITWTDGAVTYTSPVLAKAINSANENASAAQKTADDLDTSLTQQEIFNRLTNNGETQGIYLQDGKLYINAAYLVTGILSDKEGNNYWDLDKGELVANNGTFSGILKIYYIRNKKDDAIFYDGYITADKNGLQISDTWHDPDDYSDSETAGTFTANGYNVKIDRKEEKSNLNSYLLSISRYTDENASDIESRVKLGTSGVNSSAPFPCFEIYHSDYYDSSKDVSGSSGGATTAQVRASEENGHIIKLVRPVYGYKPEFYIAVPTKIDAILTAKSLSVSGTKSRIADTEDYGKRLLYCYETPTPMFGDVGEGTIGTDGKAYIVVDPVFAETITTDQYQVFLQKYGKGECYVSDRYDTYFIVKGTAGLTFGWEIKAKQSGFDQRRIEKYEDSSPQKDMTKYGIEASNHIAFLNAERVKGSK